MVMMRARDLGLSGYEGRTEIDGNKELLARIEAIRMEAGRRMGFGDGKNAPEKREIEEMVLKELRREFSPEFINRIDEVIVFNSLGLPELRAIGQLLLDDVCATLRQRGLKLVVDEPAVDWLLKASGHDMHSGARPLRRTIQRHVEDAVSELLIGSREPIECVEVTVSGDELKVRVRAPEPIGTSRSWRPQTNRLGAERPGSRVHRP